MLRLFSNPSEGQFLTGEEKHRIWLIVWAESEEPDAEINFMYGPSSDVIFKENKTDQQLTIFLESPQNIPSEEPRFSITHFTSDKIRPIHNIHHKKKVDALKTPHTNNYKSEFAAGASEAEFNLKMKQGESFYLNIIISDKTRPGRLISCDPQVENGTSTSP